MTCIVCDLSTVTLWLIVGNVLRCIDFRLNDEPLLQFLLIHETPQDPIVKCVAPASDVWSISYQPTLVEATLNTLNEPQTEYQ